MKVALPLRINKSKGNDELLNMTLCVVIKVCGASVVNGDLHGKYYTLVATNSNGTNEFVDPYAKAAGINGLRRKWLLTLVKQILLAGIMLILVLKNRPTIVLYELHVSDLTARPELTNDGTVVSGNAKIS